ncbi:DUF167 domain-containing protein [Candidatus Kaiserbacteria bacterium]|nr:DUF167 domain-containing protein [Candidatus Kaiserbacteria bacterium]
MFIKVFVTPDAKKEKIEKKEETFLVSVREPATGNRANNRVRELVALWVGKPISKVRILTGHHSRAKMISISG